MVGSENIENKNNQVFSPVARKDSLVDDVVAQVSRAILEGNLHPGDKLTEEGLGEQLGVSRAPVREALHHLETLGMVERFPYKGTFVSTLGENEIIELHSLRAVLESLAAEILAKRKDPDDIGVLKDLIARREAVAQEGDHPTMLMMDADFHDALIDLSCHHLLCEIWKPISAKMRRFLQLKRHRSHKTIHAVIAPHEKIVQAIEAGDQLQAIAAVNEHLKYVEKKFMEVIQRGDELLNT
jgi:DNA-binding GntR family transcriptional regulator